MERLRQPPAACLEPQAEPVHGCLSTPLSGERACRVSPFPSVLFSLLHFLTCQHDQSASILLNPYSVLSITFTIKIPTPYCRALGIELNLLRSHPLQPFLFVILFYFLAQGLSTCHSLFPCLAGSSSSLSSHLIDVTSSKRLPPTNSIEHGSSFLSFIYIQPPVCLSVCFLFTICQPH